jgi:hypothetical protein
MGSRLPKGRRHRRRHLDGHRGSDRVLALVLPFIGRHSDGHGGGAGNGFVPPKYAHRGIGGEQPALRPSATTFAAPCRASRCPTRATRRFSARHGTGYLAGAGPALRPFHAFTSGPGRVGGGGIAARTFGPLSKAPCPGAGAWSSQYARHGRAAGGAPQPGPAAPIPNTLTVTTGHQLCLFTGPLYVVVQGAQRAVRLARVLSTRGAGRGARVLAGQRRP